jgi:hypothetical protein
MVLSLAPLASRYESVVMQLLHYPGKVNVTLCLINQAQHHEDLGGVEVYL